MKKEKFKNLKNIHVLFSLLLAFLLFLYKVKMGGSSFLYFFSFLSLFLILVIEFINSCYQTPLFSKKNYIFLWKIFFTFFLFFIFYDTILLKNRLDLESILLFLLSFCPIILKIIFSISFYIKFSILKKKYNIIDVNIFTKIINTKRFVLKKEDRYKEKLKIKKIFSNNKMTKKLDSSLKTAIFSFNKNKLDKRIIQSLNLENKNLPSLKKTSNKVSYKKKEYIKGSVPTLLSKCKYYIKNNRRYKLNKSTYQYILNSYYKAFSSCDRIKGYAYYKEEKKEMTFIGFLVFSYEYIEGFSLLEKQVVLTEKKTSIYDTQIKDLQNHIFVKKEKNLKQLIDIIVEIKEYYHNLKLAFLSYFSNKIILLLFVFLSSYIMLPIFTIESLLFLEFIMQPILFLKLSLFESKKTITNISWHFFLTIFNFFFLLMLFFFLYPYFCITSLRSILFFSYLLQQIFGGYHFLLEPYEKVKKNKYLNMFLCFFLILILFVFKKGFLSLSFFSFLFVLFINLSFFFFIEIIKIYKNR